MKSSLPIADYRHPAAGRLPLFFSTVLLGAGLLLQHTGSGLFASASLRLVWYLVALLPVLLPVLREALRELRGGALFTEQTLMCLACFGAFYLGEYAEGVAVMLLYAIGEEFQERAASRVRRNIREAIDLRPRSVLAVGPDGSLANRPVASVRPGETIEVPPGGRVPLDGELLGPGASFDTSALTGESVPRRFEQGGEVAAGMIAAAETVRLKVLRPESESALARILRLVEAAAERKAPAERFIRRFARIYTPAVTLGALLIVAVPWIVSSVGETPYLFDLWLSRALVFLVAACPCALVISIPLGYFCGIGRASREGILFKGGNYLDALARVDTVVFDKTGTLTEGTFEVREVVAAEGISACELLRAVAAAERTVTHPAARALVRYAEREGIAAVEAAARAEIPGCGVRATVGGVSVLAGNTRLLRRFGVEYPAAIDALAETVVVCALANRYAGHVVIADRLREDAAQTVADLRRLGIADIRILSGDRRALVAKLGRRLGVDVAEGELSPADKTARIEALAGRREGGVAFVGDGFNDAPALAMSDVGVAMGGFGSDAAIETADAVIQSDRPSRLPQAIRIGRFTRRVVRQNILLALGVKAVVLLLGAEGIATMWEAVFADVGVTLLAVANALRISKYRF